MERKKDTEYCPAWTEVITLDFDSDERCTDDVYDDRSYVSYRDLVIAEKRAEGSLKRFSDGDIILDSREYRRSDIEKIWNAFESAEAQFRAETGFDGGIDFSTAFALDEDDIQSIPGDSVDSLGNREFGVGGDSLPETTDILPGYPVSETFMFYDTSKVEEILETIGYDEDPPYGYVELLEPAKLFEVEIVLDPRVVSAS